MNCDCIFVWKSVEIFEVYIRYDHYVTFVVWPPFVCNEGRDKAVAMDDVALLGSPARFLDSGRDPTKRAVVPFRRMGSNVHGAPPPFRVADRLSGCGGKCIRPRAHPLTPSPSRPPSEEEPPTARSSAPTRLTFCRRLRGSLRENGRWRLSGGLDAVCGGALQDRWRWNAASDRAHPSRAEST